MKGKKLKGDMSIIWVSNFKSEDQGSLSQKCYLSWVRQWEGGVVEDALLASEIVCFLGDWPWVKGDKFL